MKGKILIIDDEEYILSTLAEIIREDGYSVSTASSGKKGLDILYKEYIDLVFMDVKLPDINGIEILKSIKKEMPKTEVVMISGHGTIDTAVQAIKLGAYDFIEKPLSIERVRIAIAHALERLKLVSEKDALVKLDVEKYNMLGHSKAIMDIKTAIARCAPTESKILITGETGTGKELVAAAIHHQSIRKDSPFIKVNCAAIPKELIESELFGHEKGAFTGAISRKIGKFELADKGTIFLDEIGDMDLSCQSKVLRILETGEFERVGGLTPIKVDVRIIAATNKDLVKEVGDGKFREDLYYRLNVVPIYIPPLRERGEDILTLIKHFMDQFCEERGIPVRVLDDSAISLLSEYNYPGNIRELRNIVERIAVMVPKEVVKKDDITSILGTKTEDKEDIFSEPLSLSDAKKKFLKKYIETQLMLHNHNLKETADMLGIERTNLHRWLRELGIKKNL